MRYLALTLLCLALVAGCDKEAEACDYGGGGFAVQAYAAPQIAYAQPQVVYRQQIVRQRFVQPYAIQRQVVRQRFVQPVYGRPVVVRRGLFGPRAVVGGRGLSLNIGF